MPASNQRIGVLVVQLGTPDAPTPQALRRYLREFLSDPHVIDRNPLLWKPVLHLFILRRHSVRSAALYRRVWLPEGSPLLIHSRAQVQGLQARLGDTYRVVLGMRYGNPSIPAAVCTLEAEGIGHILVFPMFPQFSHTTTGSVTVAVEQAIREAYLERGRSAPVLHFVPPYYHDPGYIHALKVEVVQALKQMGHEPDLYLFSFHGIPQRYEAQGDPYRQHCETTACLLAETLGLARQQWTISFQSRFDNQPWLQPYTEDVLVGLGEQGVRSLLVACPGFMADCLETLDEIGNEGRALFHKGGGTTFGLASCVNDHPAWLQAMADIVRRETAGWVALS